MNILEDLSWTPTLTCFSDSAPVSSPLVTPCSLPPTSPRVRVPAALTAATFTPLNVPVAGAAGCVKLVPSHLGD